MSLTSDKQLWWEEVKVYDVDSDVEGDVCRHPGCSEGPGRLPRAPVDEDEAPFVDQEEDEQVEARKPSKKKAGQKKRNRKEK